MQKIEEYIYMCLAHINIYYNYIMTRWTDHVKAFAAKKNIAYGCALSDPDVKKGYVPVGDKKRKPEKLEQAMPSMEPKEKGIVIKPRPKAEPKRKERRIVEISKAQKDIMTLDKIKAIPDETLRNEEMLKYVKTKLNKKKEKMI